MSFLGRALRAGGRTGARLEVVDLSGRAWPLDEPAVYVANRRSVLDGVVARQLSVRRLHSPTRFGTHFTATATLDALASGSSLGFVVESVVAARAAALCALAVNTPIVPLAAQARVVIGELFYSETSSVDELTDDIRAVVQYLERLAPLVQSGGAPRPSRRP